VVRGLDRSLVQSVLQLTFLLQSGSSGEEDLPTPVPEASSGTTPSADRVSLLDSRVPELLRDVEQVVDLFFEACDRLGPVSDGGKEPLPNPDKVVFEVEEGVEALLRDGAFQDEAPAGWEGEGAFQRVTWRWLPALLAGGAAAAVALGMHQKKRWGGWLPGRRHEIE
jgi:hypothetical protein